jgi:hypothetical protein
MKSGTIPVKTVLFLLLLALLSACSLFSEEDQDKVCDEGRLHYPLDDTVYYRATFSKNSTYPTAEHNLFGALKVECQGYIRLMDCYDAEISYQDFNNTLYVKASIPPGATYCDFNITPDLLFTFNNRQEYLCITYTMIVYFEDGRKYESNELIQTSDRYKYLMQQDRPIVIWAYLDSSSWHEIK